MTIKWIILLLALLGSLYSIALEIVKYRSAGNPTPENVSDVYDAETYQTALPPSEHHKAGQAAQRCLNRRCCVLHSLYDKRLCGLGL